MSEKKYSDAIDLIAHKYGLPDFAYQEEIVNDEDKERTRNIILELKEKISNCVRLLPNRNNVIIPFNEGVAAALPREKASDMTIANRLFSAISLSALINVDNRPRYLLRKEGEAFLQTIPFATFDDLIESLLFVEDADGLRRYIREWYFDVFLGGYNLKRNPDSKNDDTGNGVVENIIALTTEQLVDLTYEYQKKKLSKKQILETYIYPLLNHGYIDAADSSIDKRSKIFYPIVSMKNINLFVSEQSNNFLQQIQIRIIDPSFFPSKEYLISKIQHILKYSSEKEGYKVKKIVASNNQEISVEALVENYYSNPERYFEKDGIPDEYFQKGNIASESQEDVTADVRSNHSQIETHENLFVHPKSNNFLYSCYYCNDTQTNNKQEYERHVVMKHPKRPAYPAKADLEGLELSPKGYEWELVGA